MEKPLTTLGIGVDAIPDFVKESKAFDGNDLGKLGNVEALPTDEEINTFVKENFEIKAVLSADDDETVGDEADELGDIELDEGMSIETAEEFETTDNEREEV